MASTTLTYTAQQGSRIATAYGDYLGLGRNATAAEVKAAVIAYIRTVVYEREKASARVSAESAVTTIDPT